MALNIDQPSNNTPWPIASIDVIRGLAALGVAVAHFGQQEVNLKSYGAFGMFLYQLGTWGVTIFFVLSGFCIHGATLQGEKMGRAITWRDFFSRRFFRIYPAFLLSLLAAALASHFYQSELLKDPSLSAALKHVFLVSNFDSSDRCSLNGVVWSVVMECHFYLLYPTYLWLVRRIGDLKAFLMVFVFGWVYFISVTVLTHPGDLRVALQFTFPGLWWKWCLGAVLAKLYFDGNFRFKSAISRPWVLPAVCLVSFLPAVIPKVSYVLLFQRTLLPFILGLFLMALVLKGPSFLKIKTLQIAGLVSYSIYLFHSIVLAPFTIYSTGTWFVDLMVFLILTAVTGGGGYLIVEKPFMALGRRIRYA